MQRDGGPGGPGAGGNPTGGSFTGPAETLEIVGDHCYCYPAVFTADTAPLTRMNFKTGNFYTVGIIRFAGYTDPTSPGNGNTGAAVVKLNGAPVLILKADGAQEDQPFSDTAELIIPSYTEVVVTVDSSGTDATFDASISYVGRIYRG